MGQDCTGQQRRWASYWLTAEAKCCKHDPKLWELKRKGAGLHVDFPGKVWKGHGEGLGAEQKPRGLFPSSPLILAQPGEPH